MTGPRTSEIARFFDCCQTPKEQARVSRLSRRATRELVRGIASVGISDAGVVEVGCGRGDLLRELVSLGARRGIGVDLAPLNLEQARDMASAKGLDGVLEFRQGNGATDVLVSSDVMVLNKVICCYPDVDQLIENTTSACRSTYAFVIPRSSGIGAVFVKAAVKLGNLMLKFRKCGFRSFVHDADAIDESVVSAGFREHWRYSGLLWSAVVYVRI